MPERATIENIQVQLCFLSINLHRPLQIPKCGLSKESKIIWLPTAAVAENRGLSKMQNCLTLNLFIRMLSCLLNRLALQTGDFGREEKRHFLAGDRHSSRMDSCRISLKLQLILTVSLQYRAVREYQCGPAYEPATINSQ